MKTKMRRLMMAAAVVIMGLVFAIPSEAKYSKASTNFTYEGVRVNVIDRHEQIGKILSDTYGYIEFENRNSYPVEIKWKAYGVLNHDGKLEKVDGGKISIRPGKIHKEVYSYSSSSHNYRDFKKYVVAIELVGQEAATAGGTSQFKKDGVTVTVNDRRNLKNTHSDSYGYAEYYNDNTEKVKVKWECYGNLKNNNRRVKLESGAFMLNSKETRKEVFPYSNNTYTPSDFRDYKIEIVVEKVGAPATDYDSLVKRLKNSTATQDDYARAIQIISDDVDFIIRTAKADHVNFDNDAQVERLEKKVKTQYDRMQVLGKYVDNAYRAGKLNDTNTTNLRKLIKRIQSMENQF